MKNIYAYTGTTYPYPAYLSVNQKADSIEISIRNDGDTGIGCICLTEKQCEHLALALLEHIKPEADQLQAEVERLRGDKETLLSHMDTFMRVSNDPAIYNLAKVVIERLASDAAPKDEAMDKLVKLSEELGLYDGAAQKETDRG